MWIESTVNMRHIYIFSWHPPPVLRLNLLFIYLFTYLFMYLFSGQMDWNDF